MLNTSPDRASTTPVNEPPRMIVSRLQRDIERRQLVGQPGDAVGRMVEHRRRDARLLDDVVAMTEHRHPSQIDVHRRLAARR